MDSHDNHPQVDRDRFEVGADYLRLCDVGRDGPRRVTRVTVAETATRCLLSGFNTSEGFSFRAVMSRWCLDVDIEMDEAGRPEGAEPPFWDYQGLPERSSPALISAVLSEISGKWVSGMVFFNCAGQGH